MRRLGGGRGGWGDAEAVSKLIIEHMHNVMQCNTGGLITYIPLADENTNISLGIP